MARGTRGTIGQGIRAQTDKLLRTGKRYDKFDQIRQRHFWSSYFFKSTNGYIQSGRYTLFTTPVGSNGQGFPSGQTVSERESNWKSQNRVPDNQNFQISELGCAAMPAYFANINPPVPAGDVQAGYADAELRMNMPNLSGLANFFQSAVLSITYLTNSVPLGLLADFAQSSGPFLGSSNGRDQEGANQHTISNGFAAPALRRKYKIPILLQAGESFNFTIDVPRPTLIAQGELAELNPAFLLRMDFFATESFVEKS